LDKAAEQFRQDSFSADVEEAVLERLKRDKIHPEKLTKSVKRRLYESFTVSV
jgi:hypothetical protein